jgi:hypothetical protein
MHAPYYLWDRLRVVGHPELFNEPKATDVTY